MLHWLSEEIRKADPQTRRAAMRAIIYAHLPLLAPGWGQKAELRPHMNHGSPTQAQEGLAKVQTAPTSSQENKS